MRHWQDGLLGALYIYGGILGAVWVLLTVLSIVFEWCAPGQ